MSDRIPQHLLIWIELKPERWAVAGVLRQTVHRRWSLALLLILTFSPALDFLFCVLRDAAILEAVSGRSCAQLHCEMIVDGFGESWA